LLGQFRQHLGPCQRGPFARNKQSGFPPNRDVVEAKLALAMDLGLLDVQVQAESALIDLRSPDRNKIADLLFNRASFTALLNSMNFLKSSGDC
jgi:hypothetical protein